MGLMLASDGAQATRHRLILLEGWPLGHTWIAMVRCRSIREGSAARQPQGGMCTTSTMYGVQFSGSNRLPMRFDCGGRHFPLDFGRLRGLLPHDIRHWRRTALQARLPI